MNGTVGFILVMGKLFTVLPHFSFSFSGDRHAKETLSLSLGWGRAVRFFRWYLLGIYGLYVCT